MRVDLERQIGTFVDRYNNHRYHESLANRERFYNFVRPHEAFNGKTPYEALREKLYSPQKVSRK